MLILGLRVYGNSIYTHNHLFGNKAEAKIFIFPAILEDCFLKCFKLVFAPRLIPNAVSYTHLTLPTILLV